LKRTIAIAGATGFIGQWFIEKYKHEYNIIALSRNKIKYPDSTDVNWKQVDLYSISSTTKALEGADTAIYLVHSMMPSTRLNQGDFEDTDILLADNFSRAAQACNLKQIIYVGGILPKDDHTISKHLKSRYEVEKTLGSRNTPLTSIRAGIIIGPNGSSFRIVQQLVKNLPLMACPEWTKSLNQPIDILDALQIIRWSVGNESTYNKPVEIGGNQIITYMDLLKITAKKMNKRRLIFSLSFITIGLSKLWVSLITGTSKFLVSPLVESLKHKMTLNPENIGEKQYLRVELQTFFRLPRSNALVFPIRCYLASFDDLMTVPKWGRRLHRVIRDLPEELATYKGFIDNRPMMLDYLSQYDDGKPTSDGIWPDLQTEPARD